MLDPPQFLSARTSGQQKNAPDPQMQIKDEIKRFRGATLIRGGKAARSAGYHHTPGN